MDAEMDQPKPTPIALVVCDNIYRESTGKTALVGLFNTIAASEFPVRHSRICVYATVASARPTDTYKLDVIHAETDEVLFTAEGPPPEKVDPVKICDFTFTIDNLVFKEPATYFIRFWGNNHLLLQRPITVTKRGKE